MPDHERGSREGHIIGSERKITQTERKIRTIEWRKERK